ncbi:TIGR02594 family protein [Pseudoduganella sp. R-43]|uniref:TIGR02594 family protein n=1 Tax=Pseudoduganella sp. R-43 TaxID=3404063 RepID=UPI003CF78C1A
MTAQLNTPPWLAIAIGELGIAAYPVGSSNPRINSYHAGTNIEGYDDKVSWCSSFVNWSFAQAGIAGTASALARSWLEWGEEIERPVPGCVAVLWRDDPASWKGHVGFYLREDPEFVHLLGGNQLGQVREHFYPKSMVLAYRWPSGVQ